MTFRFLSSNKTSYNVVLSAKKQSRKDIEKRARQRARQLTKKSYFCFFKFF